jgi:hypothetical protein
MSERIKMPAESRLLPILAGLNLVGGGLATLLSWSSAGSAQSVDLSHYYTLLGIGILAETLVVSTVLYAITEILRTVVRIENRIEAAISRAQGAVATVSRPDVQ